MTKSYVLVLGVLTDVNVASDEAKSRGRLKVELLHKNGFEHVKHRHRIDLVTKEENETKVKLGLDR